MAAPSYVYTISYVAKMLGEPEAWLEEIALTDLEPEDGCLGVIDHDDPDTDELVAITAFTSEGIEALKGQFKKSPQGLFTFSRNG